MSIWVKSEYYIKQSSTVYYRLEQYERSNFMTWETPLTKYDTSTKQATIQV